MLIIVRVAASALCFVVGAIGMEFVARFMHKYVMHGAGWCLHYDHHNAQGRFFQKNDLYVLFFASLSFVQIFFGLMFTWYEMVASGAGVGLYGIGYFLFHDVMFHKRIRAIKLKPKHPYFKRIINAHRVHHATVTQGGAVSFSFLWAPKFYAPANQAAVNAKLAEIREMQAITRGQSKKQPQGAKQG